MNVPMKYGEGRLELDIPERLLGRHEAFRASERGGATTDAEHAEAALAELEAAGFADAVRGRHVGLLVSDGTREFTGGYFLEGLESRLEDASAVTVFVCTGTHDPSTPENVALAERLAGELSRWQRPPALVVHDARHDELTEIGTTSRGTRIAVNARSGACDVFLVVANMKSHYFAGYSNPVKYIVPGIAAYETARGNHSLTLEDGSTFGRHPWHADAARHDNPLARDMVEAFGTVLRGRACFALVVVGSKSGIVWAGGGEASEVSGRGMSVVDRTAALRMAPTRFLVVSPGGAPHDESLYTSQRALELSRAAVADGGEVLFLSRCQNGIGPPSARENFFEPMKRPLDVVAQRPPGEYVMYSHKSVKFARYLLGLDAVHVVSELDPDEVRAVHMHPAESAQAVIDGWVSRAADGDRITLVDDASRFAVYPE